MVVGCTWLVIRTWLVSETQLPKFYGIVAVLFCVKLHIVASLFNNVLTGLLCILTIPVWTWARYFAVNQWRYVSCSCNQSRHTVVCQNWGSLDLSSSKMYNIYCYYYCYYYYDYYLLYIKIIACFIWHSFFGFYLLCIQDHSILQLLCTQQMMTMMMSLVERL